MKAKHKNIIINLLNKEIQDILSNADGDSDLILADLKELEEIRKEVFNLWWRSPCIQSYKIYY